ncbi:NfeD family protein [Methylobrevis pamukkalensis]|uniref:NfeD family protein n=1 Tax=Methylobrevis pamukkalensis TaxID=1439726 RepID=UPI001FDA6B89|nr:NfeD family protein [Methylobrevis pamukkalensis]
MGFFAGLAQDLGPWAWWVFAAVLAGVEILLPGTFFIWFAAAAVVVGALALVVDLGWQAELLLFLLLAVVAALVGRRWYGTRSRPSDEAAPTLNDRAGGQVGRTALLEEPLVDGIGRIRLDDTVWRVEGPNLPAGTRVRIVSVRGGRLQVEAA